MRKDVILSTGVDLLVLHIICIVVVLLPIDIWICVIYFKVLKGDSISFFLLVLFFVLSTLVGIGCTLRGTRIITITDEEIQERTVFGIIRTNEKIDNLFALEKKREYHKRYAVMRDFYHLCFETIEYVKDVPMPQTKEIKIFVTDKHAEILKRHLPGKWHGFIDGPVDKSKS